MDDIEERIRRRAYEIWEREGRPHGRDAEHWLQAREEVLKELPPAERAEAKAQVPEKPPAGMKRAKSAPAKPAPAPKAGENDKPKPKKSEAGAKSPSATAKQPARGKA